MTVPPSSPTPANHSKAASLCCSVYEKEMVSRLVRGHARPDKKLTATERARLTQTFFQLYHILLDPNSGDRQNIEAQMAALSTKDMFYVRELSKFLFCNAEDAPREEMARLMGQLEECEKWDKEKYMAILIDVTIAGNDILEKKSLIRYSQPDFAPLGMWAMFDDWQEVYMEQFEEGYLENRWK